MITVAVLNVSDISHKIIQFIFQMSKQQGLKVDLFIPKTQTVYKQHKKLPLKHYITTTYQPRQLDLLIVALTKEALSKAICDHVAFHIVVMPELTVGMNPSRKIYQRFKEIKCIENGYYVVPKKHTSKKLHVITYGWHKEADISVSSAQTGIDGGLSVQYCVGDEEFNVHSNINDTESILAGVAILRLYYTNFNQSKKES